MTSMNIEHPIDLERGLICYGDNENIYYLVLPKFLKSSAALVKSMSEAYTNRDSESFMLQGHKLKGASAYVGASRVHYCCFFI